MRKSIGFFVFAFSLLSSAFAAGSAEPTRSVVITRDGDYFGFDLRTEQNVTLDQCRESCIADQSCRAFTYNPKVKWCFLKSDFSRLDTFPGAVAGKIVVTAAEPDIGAPSRLPFASDQLRQDAQAMRDNLSITEDQQQLGQAGLLMLANNELSAGNYDSALAVFKAALSITPDDAGLWTETARSLNTVTGRTDIAAEAAAMALNGYQLTRTAQARADVLAVLAKSFENSENYRAALNAYKASLALVTAKTVQTAYNELRETKGFRVVEHTIDTDSATPRACVQFSDPLVKRGVDYAPFVLLDGAPAKAVEAKDNQICVEGLQHGARYTLALRAGLPSSVDEPLLSQVDLSIYVRDRSPTVRFTGDSFVLPSTARRGIPLVSVNTDSADLKLYRIGERNIAPLLAQSKFLTQLDGYDASRIEDESGELVWQGKIEITSELNKDVVTSFPVDEALPKRQPGIYVLTAAAAGSRVEDWNQRATQWFLVSDVGLQTFAGTDGLNVFARSLASAKPLSGVELQLLATNNEVLGTAVTDADGHARFDAGLIRGGAALAPAAITAKKGEDDYVFLDMKRAGFDLSDRGVTGRPAPGAIDILPWTERGIYRPGETVHAAALARDTGANAITDLPLTFVFTRPDGVEYRRMVETDSKLGGYAVDLPLLASAMRGTWTMQIYTDPKKAAIGQKQFLVDDFVPDRTEFDLTSEAKDIAIGTPVTVDVDGRYLYGAPAAGLVLEGEVNLKRSRTSAAFENYQFGLVDEETDEETRLTLEDLPALDEEGKASFEVSLDEVPSTTQMLNADIVVRMQEGGGRAVERTLTLPVRPEGPMIGIKPEFSGDLAENTQARFHVIAIDAEGKKQPLQGARWRLVNLERNYQWYRDGSSWTYEPIITTKQIADGTVDITGDGAAISVPVAWGRYRLEVESAVADGPATSVEFEAGWYVEASSTETPDALEIGLDKENYAIGETAKLKVSPRFAGELLVTVGTDNLITAQTATIPAEGGEVDLPVTDKWGAGAYVTATLFRPGEAQESRMPMRAIGVTWLAVDPGANKLEVSLAPPEKTLPRQPLTIPVQVKGAGIGEEAYVTVAAVDVGILNLTRYEAPDPEDWYFGQRRLGLEIRDLYGRLIDGSLGAMGRLRTGGDGAQMPLQGKPPTEKLVAFFSGPLKLDGEGKAEVSFDIPQFNGTARVMAVAWSKTGVGHASADVVIRDPVVVTASMPRFLSPGDESRLRLEIAATDAPSGDYQLQVTTNTALAVDTSAASQTVNLTQGGKTAINLPLAGTEAGTGRIDIALTGAGLSIDQSLEVPVRPAALPVTERRTLTIAAGKSLIVDGELLADSILQDASVSLNVMRAEGFDIPALLMSLDRYPYGCAEQTTSRALPLLYFNELSAVSGLPQQEEITKRVQDAIYRVLAYQSSSGSFGLWSPGYGDLWLDSYVTEFLTRAREQNFEVPDQAMIQALDNLQNQTGYDIDVKDRGDELAYALYVLARNKRAAISDLRYYADTRLGEFPTPLSKAHLAAALALYGDGQRSKAIFTEAAGMTEKAVLTTVSFSYSDYYGSTLRDGAAILALAAESRPVPPILSGLSKTVSRELSTKRYTSTQEQTWTLLAARALQKGDNALKVDVNGASHTGGYMATIPGDQLLAQPVVLTNRSSAPITAAVTTVAAPKEAPPAGGEGFTIERTYYTLDGEEANVTEAQQNERYVVVLSVTEADSWPSQILITDLLPAGFEIDNPSLVDSAQLENFDWIGETEAAHLEFRNDRFVAAIDRPADNDEEITLAYVVRAVTPGTYAHPAAQVEDMYRPEYSARTATGRMEVKAAP